MSEKLKTEKALWAEKKHHGSRSKREAAVSVQAARIIDKLLERSQGLNGNSTEYRTNALTAARQFEGATPDNNRAVVTDILDNYNLGQARDTTVIGIREDKVKLPFRKPKTVKTATITTENQGMLDPRIGTEWLKIDPEGKQRPVETHQWNMGKAYSNTLGPEELVAQAAPALYEVKKAIDNAEEQTAQKAA